jgi:uncharacterized protein YuzE
MKAVYDPHTDTLTLTLNSAPVAETDEKKPGIILDFDDEGNLLRIEILDASRRVGETRSLEFRVAG